MSDLDRTEIRELRDLLRGAQQDLIHERGRVAAAEVTIRQQDGQLERVTADLNRFRARTEALQDWKAKFTAWALELPDSQRAGMPEPEGVDL